MYFLTLLYLDESKNDFRNVNLVGYWKTKEEAENVLKNEWKNIHEHWGNAALIQFHDVGYIHGTRTNARSFYYTKNIDNAPVVCEEPKVLKNILSLVG